MHRAPAKVRRMLCTMVPTRHGISGSSAAANAALVAVANAIYDDDFRILNYPAIIREIVIIAASSSRRWR